MPEPAENPTPEEEPEGSTRLPETPDPGSPDPQPNLEPANDIDLAEASITPPLEALQFRANDTHPEYDRKVLRIGPINLIIEPKRQRQWDDFVTHAPLHSVALDGYLQAESKSTDDKMHRNFDHHGDHGDEVNATCLQVYKAIKKGFMENHFDEDGNGELNVYVNDCDEDTLLAVALLANYTKFSDGNDIPEVTELVQLVSDLDTSTGSFTLSNDSKLLHKATWLTEPFTSNREKVSEMDGDVMALVFEAFCHRFTEFVEGRALLATPRDNYTLVEDTRDLKEKPNEKWIFFTEMEQYARIRLGREKVTSYVRLITERGDGNYQYVIGRLGERPASPLSAEYEIFNAAEELKAPGSITAEDADAVNRWGGRADGGGSPRLTGSTLTPDEIVKIKNAFEDSYAEGDWDDAKKDSFIGTVLPQLLGIKSPKKSKSKKKSKGKNEKK